MDHLLMSWAAGNHRRRHLVDGPLSRAADRRQSATAPLAKDVDGFGVNQPLGPRFGPLQTPRSNPGAPQCERSLPSQFHVPTC